MLFITVHQVYELWFKLVLRELASVRDLFRKNPVPDQSLAAAVRSLRRCVTIFELATEHWRVVETLNTRDYLAFREALPELIRATDTAESPALRGTLELMSRTKRFAKLLHLLL